MNVMHGLSITKSVLLSLLLACSLVLISSGGVLGADKREYRKTPTGKGALTAKMIRSCIKLKKKLDQKSDNAVVENDDLQVMSEELELMSQALSETEQSLDRNDQDAVAEHNKNIELYGEKQAEYQARVEEYTARIGPYKKLVKKFKKQCDGQLYYDDDYAKVTKELGYTLD